MATEFEALKRSLKRTLSRIAQATDSKWFLSSAILGIFAFAVARGLTALPLGQYGFNIWIFLLIDLVTTPPYVLSINRVVRDFRRLPAWKLTAHGLSIAGSFVAPYLYLLWSAGQSMPRWVLILTLSVIAGLAIAGPIRKIATMRKEVR